jgi:F420-non-reducing hydrogenase small subunit
MSKPKVAFYWCASCGGCEEAVVDLAEDILPVVQAVDIVFWPVAMDFKKTDVEALENGELAVSFINGAVRSSEQLEMVELLRRKSQLVVAFGSCAHLGGIPGLANVASREQVLAEAYSLVPSVTNEQGIHPQQKCRVDGKELTLPSLWPTVKTLDQVTDVDYYLPGCPPPVKLIAAAIQAILAGELPGKGAVLAPDNALCDECPHRDSKPEKLGITEFKRPFQVEIDPEQCLLAQGLLCLGPITRSGCDAACVRANMPCTGCMGPTSRVRDFGAKALSAIVDPLGTFYRYSLPASQIHRNYKSQTKGGTEK